jgi:[acyl-carrier-protein] S-malonyltransferase
MLAAWLDVPGVSAHVEAFSGAAGIDLGLHGVVSDADMIRDTAIAQPLIVATSLIALRTILDTRRARDVVDMTAGHSVGEITAAAVAGVLDDNGAVALVTRRAQAMAKAAAAVESGMSAVVGGDPDEVLAAITNAGLWPANVNGAGQTVAGGSLDKLAYLAENPPAKARVIPLQVAGAFHTPFMDTAREDFAAVAATWPTGSPELLFLADIDGQPHGVEALRTIVDQVTAPVRWDLVMQELLARGVTGILELAPAGVLTGLAKRGLPGVELLAVTSPADIDAARDFVMRHSSATTKGGRP